MAVVEPWGGYVLVLKEADETRETLARVLLGSGYHVVAAATGQQAVEYVRTALPPCLILFDPAELMADSDLLLAERGPGAVLEGIPLALLGTEPGAAIAVAIGAADCLSKPVDLALLLQLVQRYCRPASRPTNCNGGHDRGLGIGAG